MRVLDELGREIERVANAAGDVRRRRRWWRPSALFVLLPLVSVGAVAVAATTGLLEGEPVRNPPGLKLDPKQGLGVVVGDARLLPPRTADPAGGPPWGVRMVKTSRGLGCVQLGRIQDGKLGVIGRDFAFNDDGKFHAIGAEVLQQANCQTADAAGNVFIAISHVGLAASGDLSGCNAQQAFQQVPKCPRASLRTIFYGLLGPEATAVTYLDADKRVVRRPVTGPEGAYVVVKATPPDRKRVGYWSPGVSPGSGLRSIEYRDGTTCMIENPARLGGAKPCPLKGFVPRKVEPIAPGELRVPIRVRVGQERIDLGLGGVKDQRRVTFSFRAPRAADAQNFYSFQERFTSASKACGSANGFGRIAKDVAAGEVVTHELQYAFDCRGRLELKVGYVQQRRPDSRRIQEIDNDRVGTVVVDIP